MPMYEMSNEHYQLVYNALSFTLASMMASTVFFFLRAQSAAEKYKSAVVISGIVTFIASYHYFRIFNSWTEAYAYIPTTTGEVNDPVLTGQPFNDAYRYMDWLLTVPLLLVEIVLVMKLSPDEATYRSWTLGTAAAIMIILGYPGELIIESAHLQTRWVWWVLAMVPFVYIVFVLAFGLAAATNSEEDPAIARMLRTAQKLTIFSWFTYPIVYLFPMLGISGEQAVVAIQVGYCISDIIAKCGVGLVVYRITMAKSAAMSLADQDSASKL